MLSGEQFAAWQSKQPQPEEVHQTEDCLKLTIRTPIGAENLPVMVWIQCVMVAIDAHSAYAAQLAGKRPHCHSDAADAAGTAVLLLFALAEAITKTAGRSNHTSRVPMPCRTKELFSSRSTIGLDCSAILRILTYQLQTWAPLIRL